MSCSRVEAIIPVVIVLSILLSTISPSIALAQSRYQEPTEVTPSAPPAEKEPIYLPSLDGDEIIPFARPVRGSASSAACGHVNLFGSGGTVTINDNVLIIDIPVGSFGSGTHRMIAFGSHPDLTLKSIDISQWPPLGPPPARFAMLYPDNSYDQILSPSVGESWDNVAAMYLYGGTPSQTRVYLEFYCG